MRFGDDGAEYGLSVAGCVRCIVPEQHFNPYRQADPSWEAQDCAAFESADILAVHTSLDEYRPTPLTSLPLLAHQLGIKQILVKDESHRFGLKAFKALGASYAVYRFIRQRAKSHHGQPPPAKDFYRGAEPIQPGSFTFCTATDGNHGRAVAWIARKLKQQAVIYVPGNTVRHRIEMIETEGAEVRIVDGSYDDAVAATATDAQKHGWQIISDTSWSGYMEIPRWTMAGYTTLFREIHEVPEGAVDVDVVFVQAGVGALAAAAAWYYNRALKASGVRLIAVEPTGADCLLGSIRSADGKPRPTLGKQDSMMAGLNCGMPSLVAWPLVKLGFDLFATVSDDLCLRAMRTYYYPHENDPRIISGESGAAGLAALISLCEGDALSPVRERIGITPDSTILLINTEGDTDPALFDELVRKYPDR